MSYLRGEVHGGELRRDGPAKQVREFVATKRVRIWVSATPMPNGPLKRAVRAVLLEGQSAIDRVVAQAEGSWVLVEDAG